MLTSNIFTIFLCITSQYIYYVLGDIDTEAFKIWGPGLNSKFNVPVRYFYIQAVDKNGEKYAWVHYAYIIWY